MTPTHGHEVRQPTLDGPSPVQGREDGGRGSTTGIMAVAVVVAAHGLGIGSIVQLWKQLFVQESEQPLHKATECQCRPAARRGPTLLRLRFVVVIVTVSWWQGGGCGRGGNKGI